MPQARRKTPFSGKAKKEQLKNKKQNKTLLLSSGGKTADYDVLSVNLQPTKRGGRGEANRYALKFYRESNEELMQKKEDALRALNPVPETELEVNPEHYFPADLGFPKRPPWDFNMTPAQLDAQEQRYFKEYIQSVQQSPHWKNVSYFELNLETWRQLWRVLEMCDILLLIVDVRYAGMMFPPHLYDYIVNQEKKDMILVLNKIDLVPASVVAAWKEHLTTTCPGLKVVYFTSCPEYNLMGNTSDKAGLQVRRRKGRLRMCAEGATQLWDACRDIVKGEVDLSSWEKKIREETDLEFDDDDDVEVGETIVQNPDTSFHRHERYKNGVLTIGCVGQPNVGKSSLLNAIMGKKVVSVSRTPGHTKHFQTIFLTPQVRLCDCPGLVFPSCVPRPIQILMGSYPIAQLREPYTTIRYLGERLDLPKLLRMDHPDNDDTWSPRDICDGWAKKRGYITPVFDTIPISLRYLGERLDLPKLLRMDHPDNDDTWSPRDICDGWAKKRGYITAKAARLDTYRAANSLLRMALDGKICLWLRPPGYTANKAKFETCEELKYIKWVQALTKDDTQPQDHVELTTSDEEQSGEENSREDLDDEEESDSDDGEELAAMANKFAALAGDD